MKTSTGHRARAVRAGAGALAASVLAITMSGCGASPGGTQASDDKTLVVWAEGTTADTIKSDPDKQGKYGQYLIDTFEKAHPGVTVKIENHGWDDVLRQNLTTALLAGTGPDIIVGENYFQSYAANDALVPLDDEIKDIKDNLIPGTLEAGQYDGKTYALPSWTGVFGFERNCTVIEEAGLDCSSAPATWDDLLTQAKEITAKGAGKYYGYTDQGPQGSNLGAVFRAAVFLNQAGAPLATADGKPNFNDPKALDVYKFLREIDKTTQPGLNFDPDEGKIYSALFEGKSAYQVAGSWHVAWAAQSGCTDCQYSMVPLPAGGTQSSLVVGNVLYAVLKTSKHVDLAKEFVKSLTTDEAQELGYTAIGRIPATKSALEAVRPTMSAAEQPFADVLLNADVHPLPQWSTNPQQVWQAWNDAFLKTLTTNDSLSDIWDEAQATAETALKG
ncbi:sugar ABC transporter substrate-binding protein [Galbitalea sp. SE-J8]|uniref:ABC transporter substrate-binding protein n=1 Tax=Galbitalea sp. SE-J8 TaxID=3054952 RepID=UPI00259C9ACD|nr:sugar ABC transporter substrate-binding protein [Galbitalea sp. SE-J8]MDM4762205.1 sugar ABC transporter substrate-binding protein [Galbitalea sp. SE-J8]